MRFGKRDKSIVDALFLLALFGVFLICALFIVLFGAKIYRNTVNHSENNFNSRTALSYISEKIRQHDNANGIELIDDGAFTTLKLTKDYSGNAFNTYLYYNDGYLCEYTTNEGNVLNKDFGTKILKIKNMKIEEENKNLYRIMIIDEKDTVTDFYISLYSDIKDKSANTDNTGGTDNAD